MHQYPVVSLSLKDMRGFSCDEALSALKESVQDICIKKNYLLTSEHVDPCDQETLARLKAKKGDGEELASSLAILCRALLMHWKKPVIVLIDEYDVPLAQAWQHGYAQSMTLFISKFFSKVLKTNDTVQFAVLTGCLRVSKESIFTGLNNFCCYGIEQNKFSTAFGFTEEEVEQLLCRSGHEDKQALIKEWYDGYRFGETQGIYCPWDILQYLHELESAPDLQPQCYWMHSSGNEIIRTCFQALDENIRSKFEILLNRGVLESKLVQTMTYSDIGFSADLPRCTDESLL